MRLGVDPRHADQVVRGTVVLPAGTGKSVRVLVIAAGDEGARGRSRRAPISSASSTSRRSRTAGSTSTSWSRRRTRWARSAQLGRVLGPRGLMPNPKAGTVTFDVGRAVREVKAGKIEFRVDKGGNVHAAIGKVSFSAEALETNFTGVHGSDRPLQARCGKGRLRAERRDLQHDGPRRHDRHHSLPVTGYDHEKNREGAAGHRADRQDQGREGALLHRLHWPQREADDRASPPAAKAGVEYVVIKNTLALRAVNESGLVGERLRGPTGLVVGKDPVAAAKVLTDFAKENEQKPAIKGGMLDGSAIDAAQVKQLASHAVARADARRAGCRAACRRWPPSSAR